MEVPYFDLKAQYATLREDILAALDRVCRTASFVLGEEVVRFEEEFAAYCGVKHCVAVNTGTSALHLALLAVGVQPGDEVITTPNTFIATAEAISYVGARPVFVDIDPATANLDPERIEAAIRARTRAIVPVHLYGRPAQLDPILAIAARHHLPVVEDACQAHGARYRGRRVGAIGDIGAFSFYPGKNLGAYGDAGALVTNRAEVADRVRMMRNYGQRKKYEHAYLAWNRRLDTMQAAVLRVKLPHLDTWNAARRRHASMYDELLAGAKLDLPRTAPDSDHVFHLYVVQADGRDDLLDRLAQDGIRAGIHYPIPIHRQEAYRVRGFGPGSFPVTESIAPRLLSLPMYPELEENQVHRIAEAVTQFAATSDLRA